MPHAHVLPYNTVVRSSDRDMYGRRAASYCHADLAPDPSGWLSRDAGDAERRTNPRVPCGVTVLLNVQ
jgi:hypothetical protein